MPTQYQIEQAVGSAPTEIEEANRLAEILEFAKRRHVMDRYSGEPYWHHLIQVQRIMIDFGYSTFSWQAAALLHDTIEDTGTTRGEIDDLAGNAVGNLVWAVTGIGANRKTRNQDIYRKLRAYPAACPLKLADRIANVEHTATDRSLVHTKIYLAEASEFTGVIGPYVSQDMHRRLNAAYDLLRNLVRPK